MFDEANESVHRVFRRVTRFAATIMDSMSDADRERLGTDIIEEVLGSPKHRLIRNLSERDKHMSAIAHSFLDLLDSYGKLFNFEIYVRRFPFGNTPITKHDYLEHCIEGYLHEVYVFQERHAAFLGAVAKYNSGVKGHSAKELGIGKSIKAANKALKVLTRVRGQHVHENRYYDDRISRLVTIHLLSSSPDSSNQAALLEGIYKQAYRETRKHWHDLIKSSNASIKILLESSCRKVEHLLPFQEAG